MSHQKTAAAAADPSPRRRAFLYVGSAEVTIKLQFLKGLRRHSITQYPYHRSVPSGSSASMAEALRTCRDDGYERIVVACDLREDGYPDSLRSALETLSELQKSAALRGVRTRRRATRLGE